MTPEIFPKDRFFCLLDEQPDFLVPARLLRPHDFSRGLIANPMCWFGWHGPLPPDKAARLVSTENFFETPWIVWIDDPATSALMPFWLGPRYAHILYQMMPGQPVRQELPIEILGVLCEARILVPPDYIAYRRREWQDAVRQYSSWFQRGHVDVPNLLHPFHVGALRRYYRYHTRHGSFQLGDGQTAGRYVAHDESVTRFFHHQLTNAVSDIAGTVVKPSYSYLALYQEGAELERHFDRPQCEYSITMLIDAAPEPERQSPWPIHLGTYDGALSIWQYIGDSLLYRGRYLEHWRDPLPWGYSSSSILLHYVDASFDGPLS